MKSREFPVESGHQGQRLDVFIFTVAGLPSRSFGLKLIKNGFVTVNGKKAKAGYALVAGESVQVLLPDPTPSEIMPQEIPLKILYEDEDIVVVDKPRGMVVHPGAGHRRDTLVNALLGACKDLSGIGGVERPGILHRLDKDTSGVLVVAKNDTAHLSLAAQLKNHSVKRIYLGLIYGHIKPEEGTISAGIGRHPERRTRMTVLQKGGKSAVTHYRTLQKFRDHSLMEFRLETGRTHQIRVHMSYKDHPLVGDAVYAAKRPDYGLDGQALHAAVLGFIHPRTKIYMEFNSELPDEIKRVMALMN
ncbi:MAG: RluA family pseudouridine synthase [Bacillota bacterium]